MQILEQFIEAKTGKINDCEDGIFISEDFIAVIDGVSQKGNKLWGRKKQKSGAYAKDIIKKSLSVMPKDFTAEQMIEYLTECLHSNYKKNIDMIETLTERLAAVVLVYSKYYNEIWNYGDCRYMINGNFSDNDSRIDKIVAEARALYAQELLLSGITIEQLCENDESHQFVRPMVLKQSLFSNGDTEYAYAVLNGKDYNFKLIEKIKLKSGDRIVLATDGYPKLFDTLDETEKYLKYILKVDPLLIKEHKYTKGFRVGNVSFDDRAYISFIID